MMKSKIKLVVLCCLIGLTFTSYGQTEHEVHWKYEAKQTAPGEYDLKFKAEIDPGWHLYSLTVASDDPTAITPNPPHFEFDKNNNLELVGEVTEATKPHVEFDPIFEMDLGFFADEAVFVQKIKTKGDLSQVKGYLEYQICNDQECKYLDEDFIFNLEPLFESAQKTMEDPVHWDIKLTDIKRGKATIQLTATIEEGWHLYSSTLPEGGPKPTKLFFEEGQDITPNRELIQKSELISVFDSIFEMDVEYFEGTAEFEQEIEFKGDLANLKGYVDYMVCDDHQCLPLTEDFSLETGAVVASADSSDGRSPWGIFIAGFIGGLLAILMPCFYPMIPLTVSFFTKQTGGKTKGISQALLYGLSIIVIFVILGFGITKAFGSDSLNILASNGIFNMAFFILFVIFAASFFGAFEITLPSSWVNKADKQAERGGLIGIFFMAFTLVLVSFSCTGPIIGSLLVEAAVSGHNMGPIVGMLGFSIALALPFTMFAIFPSWLNSLPKSGGWLNSVKVVLGFLELALAMKFLSNVDLAYHWGILKREIFLSLWIVIFTLTGLYLIGKLKFKLDSDLPYLGVTRLILAIFFFAFALYLVPGLWGAPVKLTTGLAPPAHYKEWVKETPSIVAASAGEGGKALAVGKEECPHGLQCFHDYDEGLAYAKSVGKPVMIDFTGWTCVNCRKMEDYVWVVPKIFDLIQNEYVLVSLYVDDKTKLPEDQQYESDASGKMKKIRTYGNKWSDLEASRYQRNSQPWYVLMDHDETSLNEPRGYTESEEFYNFLKSGLEEFRKRHTE